MSYSRSSHSLLTGFLLVLILFLVVGVYFDWINISYRISGLFVSHWLVWGSAMFVAVFVPMFYVLKRLYPLYSKRFLDLHVYGNLLAFLLISLHFASQVSRPEQFFPEGRTGTALYIVTILIVATGIIHRFNLLKRFGNLGMAHRNRFVHVALVLAFYLVLAVHILHNLGYL